MTNGAIVLFLEKLLFDENPISINMLGKHLNSTHSLINFIFKNAHSLKLTICIFIWLNKSAIIN